MQSGYTGTQLSKRDRHRTRKFSADEPYARASDAMLAASGLSGGKKISLQQGTFIQSKPNSLQGPPPASAVKIIYNPTIVPQNFTNIPENYPQSFPGQNADSNAPVYYPEQNYSQPVFTQNADNNPTMYYAEQNYTQPNYNINTANNVPVNYTTENPNQPGAFRNSGDNAPIGCGMDGMKQSTHINQTHTEGLPQQNYINNSDNQIYAEPNNLNGLPQAEYTSQGLIQQNFAQPGTLTGAETGSNQFINNTEVQSTAPPGVIVEETLNTSLPLAPVADAHANTLPESHTQPEPITTTIASQPAEIKKADPNAAGVFTFKPLEAKFAKNGVVVAKSDPYCKVKIGFHSGKTAAAKNQGTHPVWNESITLQKKHNEQFAKLKVGDHDKLFKDAIGETKIPLGEVATRGKTNQWYPIYKKDELAGEVLMEITFQPKNTTV